jgi:predicted nucleic acid-binding protein
MRIYLDSCVVIYLVENTPQAATVQQILANYHGSQACSSNLALLECLVAPLRDNDEVLVNAYKQFFRVCYRIPSRVQVFRVAAHLRATTNLRTPDALHLAYAHAGKCHIFLTGDKKLANLWNSQRAYPYPHEAVAI